VSRLLRTLREKFARSSARGDSCCSEAGETLIEVLLALVVLSLASVAVITAFSTTITATAEHRTLATFNTVLRSSTEQAISQIQGNGASVPFSPCAVASYYQTGGLGALTFAPPPSGTNYSAQVTGVSYWNGTAFSPTPGGCVPLNNAPQQITLTVTDNNNHTTYSNSFVVDDSVAVPLLPLCTPGNCTPTHLVFGIQPAGAAVNTAFTSQPVVWAVTAFNTIARHDASTVNLVITAGTGASGANILNSCQGVETSGVTSFSNCGIDLGSSNPYTLTATDPSLGFSVVSSSFYNYTQLNPPVITTVTAGVTTLTVAFTAPSNRPGAQTYSAEACTDAGMTLGCHTNASFTSGAQITGLTANTGYHVEVFALASNGYQASQSTVSGLVTTT
jgi:type II secretory pathway pseudopilin PulG